MAFGWGIAYFNEFLGVGICSCWIFRWQGHCWINTFTIDCSLAPCFSLIRYYWHYCDRCFTSLLVLSCPAFSLTVWAPCPAPLWFFNRHVDYQIFSYLLHPLYSHVRISESLPCCEQAVEKEGQNNSELSSRYFIPQVTFYYFYDMLDMMKGKQNTNLDALGFSFKVHGIVVEFLLSGI